MIETTDDNAELWIENRYFKINSAEEKKLLDSCLIVMFYDCFDCGCKTYKPKEGVTLSQIEDCLKI